MAWWPSAADASLDQVPIPLRHWPPVRHPTAPRQPGRPAAAHERSRALRLFSGANTRARARLVFNLDSIGLCPLIGVDQKRRVGDRHDANSPQRKSPLPSRESQLGKSGGRFSPQPSAAQSAGLKPKTPRAKQMAAPRRDHRRSPKSLVVRCRRRSSLPEAAIRALDD
jgi:hypothetical protein